MATIDTNHDRTKAAQADQKASKSGAGEIVRIYPRRNRPGVVVIRRISVDKTSRIVLRDKSKIESAKAELAAARAHRLESRQEERGVLEKIADVFAA